MALSSIARKRVPLKYEGVPHGYTPRPGETHLALVPVDPSLWAEDANYRKRIENKIAGKVTVAAAALRPFGLRLRCTPPRLDVALSAVGVLSVMEKRPERRI